MTTARFARWSLLGALIPATLGAEISEDQGGVLLTGALRFGAEIEDGDGALASGLALTLSTATRTQRLSFSAELSSDVPLNGSETGLLDDQTYVLSYLRNNGSSEVVAEYRYDTSEIDGLRTAPTEDFDETDLIDSGGTQTRQDVILGLGWGLDRSVGGELQYRFTDQTYSDTSDARLENAQTHTLSTEWRFTLSPTAELHAGLSYTLREEEDAAATRDETWRGTLGFAWQPRADLALSGEIGWSDLSRDRTEAGRRETRAYDGLDLDLHARWDQRNGAFRLSYAQDFSVIGGTHQLMLSRDLALPGGAEITAGVGIGVLPGGTEYPITELRYVRPTRSGELTFALAQSVAVNGDDEAVRRLDLRGGYRHDLPRDASLTLAGSWTESDYLDPMQDTQSVGQLALTYQQPIAPQWDLTAQISARETRTADGRRDHDNRLSVGLERTFSVRP